MRYGFLYDWSLSLVANLDEIQSAHDSVPNSIRTQLISIRPECSSTFIFRWERFIFRQKVRAFTYLFSLDLRPFNRLHRVDKYRAEKCWKLAVSFISLSLSLFLSWIQSSKSIKSAQRVPRIQPGQTFFSRRERERERERSTRYLAPSVLAASCPEEMG